VAAITATLVLSHDPDNDLTPIEFDLMFLITFAAVQKFVTGIISEAFNVTVKHEGVLGMPLTVLISGIANFEEIYIELLLLM
jgi:hypothetical protein